MSYANDTTILVLSREDEINLAQYFTGACLSLMFGAFNLYGICEYLLGVRFKNDLASLRWVGRVLVLLSSINMLVVYIDALKAFALVQS